MSSSLLLLLKKKKNRAYTSRGRDTVSRALSASAIRDGMKHWQMRLIHSNPPPPDTALRRAPRSLRSALHICNTTSSGTFLHMFWECPVVISLWTHVNLVLSSLLRIDWSVNPSLCLLNNDSSLCISSMQKRMLFAGFTAAKKTIIQNWFTPHCVEKHIGSVSLLQIVTCECATARVGGARPSTIDAWQCFLFDIRDCIKEWFFCFCCLSLSPSLFDWTLRCWVCVCCFVIFWMLCGVMCEKIKKMLMTKKINNREH